MPKPVTPIESKVEPNPSLEKRTRRVFTPEYKLSIIQQADACKHGELGALLRREKLYSNQLAQWRRELAEDGLAGLSKSAPVLYLRRQPSKNALSSWRKKWNDCTTK